MARPFLQEKPPGRRGKPVMELHVVNIPRYLARFRICLANLLCLYEIRQADSKPDYLFRNANALWFRICLLRPMP